MQAVLYAMQKLLAAGRIIQAVFPLLQSAAVGLSVLLAKADFLPFALTLFAILSRIQVQFPTHMCRCKGPPASFNEFLSHA